MPKGSRRSKKRCPATLMPSPLQVITDGRSGGLGPLSLRRYAQPLTSLYGTKLRAGYGSPSFLCSTLRFVLSERAFSSEIRRIKRNLHAASPGTTVVVRSSPRVGMTEAVRRSLFAGVHEVGGRWAIRGPVFTLPPCTLCSSRSLWSMGAGPGRSSR